MSRAVEEALSRVVWGLEVAQFCFWVPLLAGLGTVFPAPRVHFIMRAAAKCMVQGARIALTVRGRENLPKSGGFLLVSNHVNMFDPMILYAVVPRHIIAIEKASHFKWPVYGHMIKQWGNLPVSSGSTVTRDSLTRAADIMKNGTPVFIFPEGTRARSGELGKFRRGAFQLALEARVPLIPVAVKGAGKIFLEGSKSIRGGSEEVVVLPPVPLDDYGEDDSQKLADNVRELIRAELEQANAED